MACGSAFGCAQPKHCLVKKLKPKRILILNCVANNNTMSESSMLRRINESSGIPLSTLKLNIKMLFECCLIKRTGIGDPIMITNYGKAAVRDIQRRMMVEK